MLVESYEVGDDAVLTRDFLRLRGTDVELLRLATMLNLSTFERVESVLEAVGRLVVDIVWVPGDLPRSR